MSNIYHTEPPTAGKVLVKTNFGDIDIELWPKEAPLACRNFIQLSLEGYYDNTEVVRAIKGFMVQMGDPTNTGRGGSSIWDKPFKDEVHGRIKFNHRGQVAMANGNRPHNNMSQFFITLDNCDWLNGKHTIFGKVTGSTMFNVLRMGEVEVDQHDKPVDPVKILSIQVLANPFDDIVPRATRQKEAVKEHDKQEDLAKAVKNTSLLSFEDEEDIETNIEVKVRSVHDTKKKKKSSKMADSENTTTVPVEQLITTKKKSEEPDGVDFDKVMREQVLKAKGKHSVSEPQKTNRSSHEGEALENEDDEDADIDALRLQNMIHESNRAPVMQQKTEEFLKLRADLLKSRRAVHVVTGKEAEDMRKEAAFREMATPLEERRQKYMKRKTQHGDRSEETFAKLQKFTESLRAKKSTLVTNKSEEQTESYHGQVLEDKDENEGLQDWFVGKLKCKKHVDDQYRQNADVLVGDGRRSEDYVVIDPKRSKQGSSSDYTRRNDYHH